MEVSRPAARPYSDGLGLGCPCLGLGLGLGYPRIVYKVSRTGLGLETGLEAYFGGLGLGLGLGYPCLGLGLGGPGLDDNPDCNGESCRFLKVYSNLGHAPP